MSASAKLHTAGALLLAQFLTGALARPANLSIGLRTLDGASTHPADAAVGDTLGNATTLAEATGSGYARQVVTFDNAHFVPSTSGSNALVTVSGVTFNFTGVLNGITHACLIDTTNGVLIGSAPLQTTRNVGNGDSITETLSFTLAST